MMDWLRRKYSLYCLLRDDRAYARTQARLYREVVNKALFRGEGPYG